MKPYGTKKSCDACGYKSVSDYSYGSGPPCTFAVPANFKVKHMFSETIDGDCHAWNSSYMDITCPICGYCWMEKPLYLLIDDELTETLGDSIPDAESTK